MNQCFNEWYYNTLYISLHNLETGIKFYLDVIVFCRLLQQLLSIKKINRGIIKKWLKINLYQLTQSILRL